MAKVLISMREDFLQMVDELAQQEHRSRSELIRQALRDYTRNHPHAAVNAALIESMVLDEDDLL
ncbi:MAG: ribbon-helix-helix domain-containing protein [Vampirovibrionales bacterium]|nr:ribbon-helix-helix domain-containing protein [Vampirovibrionales bacterium]